MICFYKSDTDGLLCKKILSEHSNPNERKIFFGMNKRSDQKVCRDDYKELELDNNETIWILNVQYTFAWIYYLYKKQQKIRWFSTNQDMKYTEEKLKYKNIYIKGIRVYEQKIPCSKLLWGFLHRDIPFPKEYEEKLNGCQ